MGIAFEPGYVQAIGWDAFEYTVEAIFAIDIIVHFNTSLYDTDGNEIFDRKRIALHYLSEFHFWIDILATIPFGVRYLLLNITYRQAK